MSLYSNKITNTTRSKRLRGMLGTSLPVDGTFVLQGLKADLNTSQAFPSSRVSFSAFETTYRAREPSLQHYDFFLHGALFGPRRHLYEIYFYQIHRDKEIR